MENPPIYSARTGDGQWTRQATDSWFSIWDLAKPVIAQIHGYAMAGGTELASACDLVYMADDATIGYPVVRGDEHTGLAIPYTHTWVTCINGNDVDWKHVLSGGSGTSRVRK